MSVYDLIILGSGPAGCCAALYAARFNLKVLMLTGATPGGQLTSAFNVGNFPGFNAISGADLMDKMLSQVKASGVSIAYEAAKALDIVAKPITVTSASTTYQAKALLVATGSRPRMLNLIDEAKFLGHGLATCATCDGPLFKGKKVAIVGGGNTMLSSAEYLLGVASEVHVIHHTDRFRAERIPKATGSQRLIFHTFKEVVGYVGEGHLSALRLKDVKTGAIETLEVDGCFINIGYLPNNELLGGLKLASDGRVEADAKGKTSVHGVFAAGDVVSSAPRQAIVAASSGCVAALAIKEYLLRTKKLHNRRLRRDLNI